LLCAASYLWLMVMVADVSRLTALKFFAQNTALVHTCQLTMTRTMISHSQQILAGCASSQHSVTKVTSRSDCVL